MELETPDDTTIYEDALMNLKTRKPVTQPGPAAELSIVEREQIAKDYYASVRTNVSRPHMYPPCANFGA